MNQKISNSLTNAKKCVNRTRYDAWTLGGYLSRLNNSETFKSLEVSDMDELVRKEFTDLSPARARRCIYIRNRLEVLGYTAKQAKAVCATVSNTRMAFVLSVLNTPIFLPEVFRQWAMSIPITPTEHKKTYRLNILDLDKISYIENITGWSKGKVLSNLMDHYLENEGKLDNKKQLCLA